MDRRVQDDGTIVVGGQVVPTGGSQPTIASVVSYSGNTNLQSTNVEAALDELDNEKAPMTHTHDDRYFTEVEVTNLLAAKSDTTHNHDTRYYTESEIDAKIVVLNNSIAGKANTVHDHDDRYYTELEVDTKISAAMASTNLHDNPHFDFVELSTDGSGSSHTVPERLYPSSWQNYWGTNDGNVLLDADNVQRVSGAGYSMRVTFNAVSKQAILDSTVFACAPGSVITCSAWVLGEDTTGPYAEIGIYTKQDADPSVFDPGTISASIVPGTTWRKLTVSKVVPAGHNRARLTLRSFSSGMGTTGIIWWDATESAIQVIPPSDVVTGEIKMWPTATAPSGYLLCNGGTFSSTTYPALAALLGDTFGTHSGTTYYLPDFRGRMPMGVGTTTPTDGTGYSYTLGQKMGTAKRTLVVGNLPAQSGSIIAHSSFSAFWQPTGVFSSSGVINQFSAPPLGGTHASSVSEITFSNGGASTPFEILPPALGINYIIKAA